MKRVGILISGGGSNMVALCDSMTGDHPARPVIVVSDRGDAGGLAKARARGLDAHAVTRAQYPDHEGQIATLLDAAQVDIICLAGFMRILSADFVRRYDGRILNIHPSLLPKYKGLNTHARALDANDAEAGCSVHIVTPALDDGPVLGQARVPILSGDTPETLALRVLEQEHQLYPQVLRNFAST